MDAVIPIFVCGILFIGLPWIILHYITQWKKAGSISREDENLLDELYELARRLEDRVNTVERLVASDNPQIELRRNVTDFESRIGRIRENER